MFGSSSSQELISTNYARRDGTIIYCQNRQPLTPTTDYGRNPDARGRPSASPQASPATTFNPHYHTVPSESPYPPVPDHIVKFIFDELKTTIFGADSYRPLAVNKNANHIHPQIPPNSKPNGYLHYLCMTSWWKQAKFVKTFPKRVVWFGLSFTTEGSRSFSFG